MEGINYYCRKSSNGMPEFYLNEEKFYQEENLNFLEP